MAEPGLSEIVNIRGDAELGAGASGLTPVMLGPDSSLQYMQLATNAYAQDNRIKQAQQQKNLEAALSRLDDTDLTGVLETDLNDLANDYAGLLKEYSNNYDIIRNPQKNLEQYTKYRTQEAKLRSDIAASKDAKKIYNVQQKFLMDNPAWNTDSNRQKLETFIRSPREAREVFQFDQPFTADITALARAATQASTVEQASSELVNNGQYIRTTEGKVVDPTKFDETILASLNSNDQFGRQARLGFQNIYDALPQSEQTKYTNLDDFVLKNARAQMGMNSTTRNVLQANPVALQEDEQRFRAGQNALDRSLEQQRINLQAQQMRSGAFNPEASGEYKNQLLTAAFSTGVAPLDALQEIYGDNSKVSVKNEEMETDADGFQVPTGVTTTTEKPLISVVSSTLNNRGDLVVKRFNNQTNKPASDIIVSAQQANSDFNNVLGRNNASALAKASREYLKSRTGSENFDINKTKPLFGFGGREGYANPSRISFRGQTINAGVKNGKWYNTDTGQELK
jgi:hypothetical protein